MKRIPADPVVINLYSVAQNQTGQQVLLGAPLRRVLHLIPQGTDPVLLFRSSADVANGVSFSLNAGTAPVVLTRDRDAELVTGELWVTTGNTAGDSLSIIEILDTTFDS